MTERFYGKYRGTVSDVSDPNTMGRIRALVPDVLGQTESGWAMPCATIAGSSMGFFALPTVGSGVWMEFEHGDPDFPIWTGCWWGSSSELPSDVQSPTPAKVMLKTAGGHSLLLDDSPGAGGIVLKTAGGQKISITSQSIEIDNGNGAKIVLQSSTVSINDGALEVT